jgi:hydroxymethylpyrimidine pyrophosphatase-like HAD family hydrolase
MRSLLLCTDLDRTLLPNGTAPESPQARPLFRRLVAAAGVTLVYVTGRDDGLVAEAIAAYDLPHPDYRITDVGSTIIGSDGTRWAAWDEHIAAGWAGRDRDALAALIGELPGVALQHPSRQGRYKLSYEVRPAVATGDRAVAMAEALDAAGLSVRVVPSLDDALGVGLIDVLPAASGKAAAIEFLREHLGLGRADTVCAGDSGNDMDVLVGPLPAVLVANAADDVREAARNGAAADGVSRQLYLARGGVLGLNGNYAGGILEGVLHYHPERRHDLEDAP